LDGKLDGGTISVFSYTTSTKFGKKNKIEGAKNKGRKAQGYKLFNPLNNNNLLYINLNIDCLIKKINK
jgi:hypothetical protein